MNKGLEYVDRMLGTNLAQEMQQQTPQPAATTRPKTEKEQLQEELQVLKLRKEIHKMHQPITTSTPAPEQPKVWGQVPPPQPTTIPPAQPTQTGELFDPQVHIYKKQAAIEVLNQISKSKLQTYISIAGMFVTAVTSVLSSYGGAAVAGVFTIGLAFVLFKDQQKARYLENEYQITPQKKGF